MFVSLSGNRHLTRGFVALHRDQRAAGKWKARCLKVPLFKAVKSQHLTGWPEDWRCRMSPGDEVAMR